MAPRYLIPATSHRAEENIKRSRFIVSAAHAPDTETAKSFIAAIKEEFPDATHNCWAYAAGPPGDTAHVGMSDDGEPHGTAGKPMLTALLHGGLGDIAVVVTRYFGGVKLGTGGLVKAYTGSVQLALREMPRAERVAWRRLRVVLDYAALACCERVLPEFEVEVLEKDYADRVGLSLRLPEEHLQGLVKRLADLTGGQAEVDEA